MGPESGNESYQPGCRVPLIRVDNAMVKRKASFIFSTFILIRFKSDIRIKLS